ncbi:hypothetical protein M4D76_16140 [Peribacillus frigoritolerans]|uniref:hypothetical protein n=1 Tax=Peribacillus frigoritolerans TaxID=450367 RepID=UPI0021A962A2|nr:hypothetical protein [Peribacillus frigoritolerans]MCT1389826.1 hypothetical protein [Peribacillus frigoritolerans]
MKESDLFAPIKEYLIDEVGCSNVYGEVASCDVLGIHGPANIIVEMKKSLNFKVIEQAIDRRFYGHYMFVAVPKPKSISRLAVSILKQHKIGLLLVDESGVRKHLPARYNRDIFRLTNIREKIKPYHETQVGGVKSGEGKTDYSVTIENIKTFLKRKSISNDGWVSIDEILDRCETHYANPKQSVSGTLRAHWNADWCESKREEGKMYFRLKK